MAYDNTIQQALNDFAASFGRGRDYIGFAMPVWQKAFEHTPDQALTQGVTDVCIEYQGEFIPALGVVVAAVRKKVVDLGISTTHQVIDFPYCSDHCREAGGLVTTSAIYTWIAPDHDGGPTIGSAPHRKQNQTYVSVKQCMCGCKGSIKSLGSKNFMMWQHRRKKLQDDLRLDLHEFHYTNASLPSLTHKETMLPWDYDDLQEKVRVGVAANRGFHKSVRLMVDGGEKVGRLLTGKREDPNND